MFNTVVFRFTTSDVGHKHQRLKQKRVANMNESLMNQRVHTNSLGAGCYPNLGCITCIHLFQVGKIMCEVRGRQLTCEVRVRPSKNNMIFMHFMADSSVGIWPR
jgi:hypothetical protein